MALLSYMLCPIRATDKWPANFMPVVRFCLDVSGGLRKLFQIDGYERQGLIHRFLQGRAFFCVAVVRGQSVDGPSRDRGGNFGRDLDRATQGSEIRKLGGAPDFAAGSIHAVTEDGHVLIASNTGSQLGPYASGAGKVIWIVGAQKLVKDLNEGLRRIQEFVLPLEEEHMQQLYNAHTAMNKVRIFNREIRPNRVTMIIVKEALGF